MLIQVLTLSNAHKAKLKQQNKTEGISIFSNFETNDFNELWHEYHAILRQATSVGLNMFLNF
jgi:hypothetical protein